MSCPQEARAQGREQSGTLPLSRPRDRPSPGSWVSTSVYEALSLGCGPSTVSSAHRPALGRSVDERWDQEGGWLPRPRPPQPPTHQAGWCSRGPGPPPLTEQPVTSAPLLRGPGVLAAAGCEVQGRARWCWACRRGAREVARSRLRLAVTVACVPTGLRSSPRAGGTAAPKGRIQGNNPQVPAAAKPISQAPPGQVGPCPAQGPHLGPLQGADRPPAPCPGGLRGPVLSPVPMQVARRPGELARAASQVFRQLPPTEAAGGGPGPCADPPHPRLPD